MLRCPLTLIIPVDMSQIMTYLHQLLTCDLWRMNVHENKKNNKREKKTMMTTSNLMVKVLILL